MSTNTSIDRQVFISQLKKFVVDNSVVGAISGIAIGLFFTNLVTSLIGDIIIPAMVLLLSTFNFKYIDKVFSSKNEHQFHVTIFIKHFISFIFGVIATFFFVKLAFSYLIGTDNSKVETPTTTSTTDANKKEAFNAYLF